MTQVTKTKTPAVVEVIDVYNKNDLAKALGISLPLLSIWRRNAKIPMGDTVVGLRDYYSPKQAEQIIKQFKKGAK